MRLAQDLEPLKGTEESLDGTLLRTIALSSAGSLNPMAAILGGVAAQEVLKVDTWERAGSGRVGRPVCVPEGARPCSAAAPVTHPAGALSGIQGE